MVLIKGYRFPAKWVTAPCAVCSQDMTFRVSQPKRFCSRACAGKGKARPPADPRKKVKTPCATCGTSFVRYASEERRFCSRVCAGAANIGNTGKPTNVRYTTACEVCGVSFETVPSQPRRFCSQGCFGQWLSSQMKASGGPNRGKKLGRPKYLPPPLTKECGVCGTPFGVKPSHADRRRFCSRTCAAVDAARTGKFSGANNGAWGGGYEPYYGPSWRPAMRAVRQRDTVCQRCGMTPKENGRALDVHHTTAFRAFGLPKHAEANDPTNLVALCHDCHLLVEWETNRRELHG